MTHEPDLARALVPLDPYPPDTVPDGGNAALVVWTAAHDRKRGALGLSFLGTTGATLLGWALVTYGGFAWLLLASLLLATAMVGSLVTVVLFLVLKFGKSAYQALPDNADENTAFAERWLKGEVFAWNGDVFAWNRDVEAYEAELAAWDRKKPGQLEDGEPVSAEILALDGETLLIQKRGLLLRRTSLATRRLVLDRDLGWLRHALIAPPETKALLEPTDDLE